MQPFATRKSTFLVIVSVIAVFSFMIIAAAQAQAQEKEKFFMSFKVRNPRADTFYNNTTKYDVYNDISSNMNKSFPTYNNKKIEFDVKGSDARISNIAIHWNVPFTIIYTSTPNIIRSQHSVLTSADITHNLVRNSYNAHIIKDVSLFMFTS